MSDSIKAWDATLPFVMVSRAVGGIVSTLDRATHAIPAGTVSVSTGGSAIDARTVVAALSASMSRSAIDARTV